MVSAWGFTCGVAGLAVVVVAGGHVVVEACPWVVVEVVGHGVLDVGCLVAAAEAREGVPGGEGPAGGSSVGAAHDDGEGALGPVPQVERRPAGEGGTDVELDGRGHRRVIVAVHVRVRADRRSVLDRDGDVGDGGDVLAPPRGPTPVRDRRCAPIPPGHLALPLTGSQTPPQFQKKNTELHAGVRNGPR